MGYLALGTLFAVIYHLSGGILGARGWWDAFFFSIVTQATVGYGNMVPDAATQPWVILHSLLASVYTAVGGGLVFVKMLLPPRRSLILDTELMYDPEIGAFNLRIKNDLGVTLYMVEVEIRVEYRNGDGALRHEALALCTPKVHRIRSGTIYRLEFQNPSTPAEKRVPGFILTPEWFRDHPDSVLEVVAFANYFAGDASQEKDYRPIGIHRRADGTHADVVREKEHVGYGNVLCGTYSRDWVDGSLACDPEIRPTMAESKSCASCLGKACPIRLDAGCRPIQAVRKPSHRIREFGQT